MAFFDFFKPKKAVAVTKAPSMTQTAKTQQMAKKIPGGAIFNKRAAELQQYLNE